MKIGIYGGTFNPPHLGHLTAATAAIAMLKLDKPYTAPDFDTAEQQIAETGLSLDMLDKRAREAFSQKYSTAYDRYECAIGWGRF